MLLAGCKTIKDPVDSCVINSKFGAECGKRDLNYKNKSVGEFVGKTELKPMSFADNYVCFSGKDWSDTIKPYLKEASTKYRQRQRKR